jgi:hypothetical protein
LLNNIYFILRGFWAFAKKETRHMGDVPGWKEADQFWGREPPS